MYCGESKARITPPTSPPSETSIQSSPRKKSGVSPVRNLRTEDVNDAREASIERMLNVWDGLAQRYPKHIDEDDIIDLTTGEIVQDRGILRNMENEWSFGRFADDDVTADPDPNHDVYNVNKEFVEEQEEDSADELDTLPRSTAINAMEEVAHIVRRIQVLDPTSEEDARDLREFLEAEKRRRDMCGYEDSEDSGSIHAREHDGDSSSSSSDDELTLYVSQPLVSIPSETGLPRGAPTKSNHPPTILSRNRKRERPSDTESVSESNAFDP